MTRIVKKPEERRDEIIDLAMQLFWQNDYESTSMNQIVSKLNIAKGTIYHYFKSKEELMFAVIDKQVSAYIDMIKEKLKKAPKKAIDKFLYLLEIGKEPDQSKIDHLHKPGNNTLHTCLLARVIMELAPFYEEVIKEGNKEGVFKVDYPLETAELLLSGTFMIDVGVYPWQRETLERRIKVIPLIMESVLGASKGAFKKLKI